MKPELTVLTPKDAPKPEGQEELIPAQSVMPFAFGDGDRHGGELLPNMTVCYKPVVCPAHPQAVEHIVLNFLGSARFVLATGFMVRMYKRIAAKGGSAARVAD